jgi:hypothetical protein
MDPGEDFWARSQDGQIPGTRRAAAEPLVALVLVGQISVERLKRSTLELDNDSEKFLLRHS